MWATLISPDVANGRRSATTPLSCGFGQEVQ
jgi:hypothetical protein